MMEINPRFREELLDIYSEKPNYGKLDMVTHKATLNNPACDDVIYLELNVVDGKIVDAGFTGNGCLINIISNCVFLSKIKGMDVEDVLKLSKKDVDDFLGMEIIPLRAKCELLALEAAKKMLEIKDLYVEIDGKEILKGVNLKLDEGKVNVLMGPNGSGKSTLAHVIAGHPGYKITKGEIIFDGLDITNLKPNERAKKGIFLSFQHPIEVSGVTIYNFLKSALNSLNEKKISVVEFREILKEKAEILGIDDFFLGRYLNGGFSGGEKKKGEILQLLTLNPKFAILDETDSGLDIDSLKLVSKGINNYIDEDKGVLIITHYKRILEHIKPDNVFIMVDGRIVSQGNGDLVDKLEEVGYGWVVEENI